MQKLVFSFLLLVCFLGYGQVQTDTLLVDNKYLEDQFYLGLTYNFLLEKPDAVSQSNLSYGLQGGLIKDIPLNKERNIAMGLGLGYGYYTYYSNLRALESDDSFVYDIIEDKDDFKRSKVETHMLELPVEFRWRNSNALSHKFWRIYAGVKFGYVVGGRSKYVPTEGAKISFYNEDIKRFQYGPTLNFGYNTFNLHAYYALSNLFNDNVGLNGNDLKVHSLRIGLIFYIL
ncbi:porin family protein [Cytophaga sp. FL35]|uniref:porin family protein n=1 Tax=Cytophaga sp. FL35 TaxID=1904456 RepID=UPI001653ABEF|nr:porin family protein [Cytophaga sp. FL35]MBC6997185.1 PorT family protein [Cytophaga sp. FL35]